MKFSRAILILSVLLFSSCASIISRKYYKMNVCSIQENSSLGIYNTVYKLPAKIKVKRSADDLPVVLKTNGSEKEFILKASPTRTAIFTNLPYVYMMPVAYAVDHYTKKRYYYGQDIVLDAGDSVQVLNKGFFPTFPHKIFDYFNQPYRGNKGQINLIVGSPLQNNLYLDNDYGKQPYNFWGGLKIGLEYFYTDRRFLSLTASHVHGVVFKGCDEGYTDPFSTSFELKNNYGYKRFTFGYGLNYSINNLQYARDNNPRIIKDEYLQLTENEFHNYNAGLALSGHFRFFRNMYAGINYRPNILLLENKSVAFRYEHLISFELLFKLRVRK